MIRRFSVIAIFTAVLTLFSSVQSSAAIQLASQSKLKQGRWVKIRVERQGVQAIDYDTLRRWGFDNPSKVAVYGYSPTEIANHTFSSTSDDLPVVTVMHKDNRLYFYSDKDLKLKTSRTSSTAVMDLQRNRHFSDLYAYYFLTDEQSVSSMSTINYSTSMSANSKVCYGVEYYENEVQSIGEGGAQFHDRRLIGTETQTFSFKHPGFDPESSKSSVIRFVYALDAPATSSAYRMDIAVNGVQEDYSVKYTQGVIKTSEHELYSLAEGRVECFPNQGEQITASFSVPEANAGAYYALDRCYFIYPSNLSSGGYQAWFSISEICGRGTRLVIENPTEYTEVWEISDGQKPSRFASREVDEQTLVTTNRSYTASNPGRLIVFERNADLPTPEFVEVVENQNLHADTTPDYLIITTATLQPYAEELAQIHRDLRGLDVKVVVQDQIFNEFSSGARSPHAYRRYAKMLNDRNPGRLRWILMYGNTYWDNRQITYNAGDVLVGYQAESIAQSRNVTSNFCADQYFGMLEDDYDHSYIYSQPGTVAVGRLPISNASEAEEQNAKVRNFIINPPHPSTYHRALMVSEVPETSSPIHYFQCAEAVDTIAENIWTIDRVDLSVYPIEGGVCGAATRRSNQTLHRGVGYWGFNGHGNNRFIGFNRFWSLTDNSTLENTVLPFAVVASCNTFAFDRPAKSVGTNMLMVRGNGVIGLIASGREAFLNHNKFIITDMAYEYAHSLPGTTYGELFLNARNRLLRENETFNTSDVPMTNWLQFNYGGDPSLEIPIPEYGIVLEDEAPALTPLVPYHLKANVDAPSAATMNGSALVEVYNAPKDLSFSFRYPGTSKDSIFELKNDADVLAEYVLPMTNGVIEGDIILPEDIRTRDGVTNKIVISTRADNGHMASGVFAANLAADAPEDAISFGNGPEFVSIGIQGVEGDEISTSSAVVLALVSCEDCALMTSSIEPGRAPSVTLDGLYSKTSVTTSMRMDDGTLQLRVPLNDISDGFHHLEFSICDIYGRTATANYTFNINTIPLHPVLTVNEGENGPVRSEAVFDLAEGVEGNGVTLTVTDLAGQTVYSSSNPTMPFSWDLKTAQGTPVPDGKYAARLSVRSGNRFGSSEPVHFVVVKEADAQ